MIFPTLSPRDEDLVRRSILQQEQCGGIDVKWWSADFAAPTGSFANYKGWNKLLTGRFLLNGARGLSRPMFFKLFPAGGSEIVLQDARILQSMLTHIKVLGGISTGDRSLLITEKIGSSNVDPIPLDDFLAQSTATVQPALMQIVKDITQQLAALGNPSPNQLPLNDLIWEHHDPDRLGDIFNHYSSNNAGLPVSPPEMIRMLSTLRQNQTVVRIEQRLCHGDLNPTNVALDISEDGIHAYIIDPSGMRATVNVWDFATLEITSLLHQEIPSGESLVRAWASLFSESIASPVDLHVDTHPPAIANTLMLVVEIRMRALQMTDPKIYALMLFDLALIQAGGLAFQSVNKIRNPADAVLLASQAARLLRLTAPEWIISPA